MRVAVAAVVAWGACADAAQPSLPRGASLGLAASVSDPSREVVVSRVLPGSSAELVGVRAGDAVTAINGARVASTADLLAAARLLKEADELRITVRRSGRVFDLTGRAVGRPLESYDQAVTRYGAVSFGNGQLRDILIKPLSPAKGKPVVFLMQGFACASVESPDAMHPYRQLVSGLVARGIAVYRIEKPGMGDSRGTPECADIRLETELRSFEAGYKALGQLHGYTPQQTFIFGHSLGGMEAPFIAARNAPPRGIAVFGVAVRNWYDYVLDVIRVQDVLSTGADPVQGASDAEAAREPLRQLYLDRRLPADVANADPKAAEVLRGSHEWDGGNHLFGRHYLFLQDLAAMATTQPAAWRDARTNVLALYGESDLTALSGDDARLVATIANHYRPGSGSYVELKGLEHGMTVVGSREEYAQLVRAGRFKPMTGTVGQELIDRLVAWITGLT